MPDKDNAMHLSVRQKLLIISIAPLLLSVALGGLNIRQTVARLEQERVASENLEAIASLSKLIGSLQRERGMSSLLLSGNDYTAQVETLRSETDTAWQATKSLVEATDIPPSEQAMVVTAIDEIATLRGRVDSAAVSERSAFTEYTRAITALLNAIEAATRVDAFGISDFFRTIVMYEEAKEYAGRSRALVSSIYTKNQPLSDGENFELINTFASIQLNLKSRAVEASPKATIALNELMSSEMWYTMQAEVLHSLSEADTGAYNRDPMAFFDTATTVISGIQHAIDISIDEAYAHLYRNQAELNSSIIIVSTTVSLSVLFIAILSMLVLANITRRIAQVSSGMAGISSGDADLTLRIETISRDELGLLASHFNSFAAVLRDLVQRVKTEADQLQDGFLRLSSNTEETAGAIRQITANIESIKQQTSNQNASVTESSANVEQINRSIGTLYRLIERQAEGVSTSSSSIEEMVANIQSVTANIERMGGYYEKLLGKSESGKQAIETVAKQVKEIDGQSETLQEANSLIAGIAAQTNLLAMNAAIEAAHAGQAGMGFAVVADEIRKLAENAATQSKNISHNIKNIRSVINAVVDSSGTSARTFEDILEQIRILSRLEEEIRYSMQEQSTGSSQVLDSISNINEITTEVRESAEEMQDGSNTVLLEMRHLLQLASELDNGMTEMAAGAEEIRRAAEDTNDLSGQTSRSVRALKDEVDKFKT
ncbi:MAG: methyl-accepting chemotaxis protein [Clostridia bacterium]|jgi:methyl-accepting chemotaxis protein